MSRADDDLLSAPGIGAIREAAVRIRPFAHRTPVLTCGAINRRADAQLFFKCENFQKVGAFKFRGACNTVMSLTEEEASAGVATHSSGNHAAALALAARLRGTTAHIVMPENAPAVKRAAVEGYGGRIRLCTPTLAAREATLAEVVAETGATVVHPYNDPRVIAGQGTAALELLEEVADLDVVMTPVGGGGLLSGTAIATKAVSPRTRVIAGEPAGADDARRSLLENRIVPSVTPRTIADGLLTSLGTLTFPIIREHVEAIVAVSEEAIVAAMRLVWERMKIVIEPSSAVPLAGVLEGGIDAGGQGDKIDLSGRRIGIILTGGNVDLGRLPWNA